MSGVYIKGMDMPKTCFDCPFMYGRIYCRANNKIEFSDSEYTELKGHYDGCPLAPVPDHGRLVDADAAERHLIKMQAAQSNLVARGVRKSRAVLRDLPTIIPASEEARG